MYHALRGRPSVLSLAALLLACPAARAAEGAELEQFEERCITRAAERGFKAGRTERALWLKELEAAYPGKVVAAITEEEYATWYDLLAGKNEEWRREDALNPQIAALFDKVLQRLELGPLPTIKREEFRKYARKVLREGNPPEGPAPDANEDADKAFRALDRNGDGELDRDELTAALKDDKVRTDADGNGTISKVEYRDYFRRKVALKTEALAAKAAEAGRDKDGKPGAKAGNPGTGLPDWFTALDLDKDGQVSLFEWRKGGRPTATFQEMDLNGDGLLTKDEYLRYVRLKEIELNQKKREENPPPPP